VSKYDKLQIQKEPPERQRGPGRPRGKASNPDYISTTILLRKDVKKKNANACIDEGRTFLAL
jgi:hypothetical protein